MEHEARSTAITRAAKALDSDCSEGEHAFAGNGCFVLGCWNASVSPISRACHPEEARSRRAAEPVRVSEIVQRCVHSRLGAEKVGSLRRTARPQRKSRTQGEAQARMGPVAGGSTQSRRRRTYTQSAAATRTCPNRPEQQRVDDVRVQPALKPHGTTTVSDVGVRTDGDSTPVERSFSATD